MRASRFDGRSRVCGMAKLTLLLIAAGLAWGAEPAPVRKPCRIGGFFRKIGAAEVNTAERISSLGVPDPERPPRKEKRAEGKQPLAYTRGPVPAPAIPR